MKETAEETLIQLGLSKLSSVGVRGLKVRRLCDEVGISPGTFTTHFKTRREYIDRVLEAWYEPLRGRVEDYMLSSEGHPIDQLRAILVSTARFFRTNAGEMLQLMMDVKAGEVGVQHLLSVASLNHIKWIRVAISNSQKAGEIVQAPIDQILLYLFGGTNFPTLIYHLFPSSVERDVEEFARVVESLTEEEKVIQRLDWALQGIKAN
jgi:AcrR family transcriptional regulator